MIDTDQLQALEQGLSIDAQHFIARNADGHPKKATTIIVADLEFIWCRESHKRFVGDKVASIPIRWPFDRVAAACWANLTFYPDEPAPLVEDATILSADEHDEAEIVACLFEALHADPSARLVMWGSEQRDMPVLRRAAMMHELALPTQLLETSPSARGRIDLCREITGLGEKVKLAELAASFGIPAKPVRPEEIGNMAEHGHWKPVREQCAADVAVTALLAARYLKTLGQGGRDGVPTDAAIAEAFAKAFPASGFATGTLAAWARGRIARSKLKGLCTLQRDFRDMKEEEKMT